MPKKTDRARKAGAPIRGHVTTHGESQRESSARMSSPRVAAVKRIETKKFRLEVDPKTGRLKR
jgi:hypothetical protein